MSQEFLAVLTKTVVDQPFEPAKEAVVDEATGDEIEPAVDEQPYISHEEVERCYIEDSAETVAANLAADLGIAYYAIEFDADLNPSLSPAAIKNSTKKVKPKKMVRLQAGGKDLAEAEVDG